MTGPARDGDDGPQRPGAVYAPVLRIVRDGFGVAFRSRRTVVVALAIAGLLWGYLALLGTPLRLIVAPALVALPPVSTWFDVAYALDVGGGTPGILALVSLFLLRGVVVTAFVGLVLADMGGIPGEGGVGAVRRGLRVLPIALLIDLFQFSVLLPAQALLQIPFVGVLLWFLTLGLTTLLVYAVVDAWRRDIRQTESVLRAVRAVRMRGGGHVALGLAYVMTCLLLTSLWGFVAGRPELAIPIGAVSALINLGFVTTFVRRWVAIEDDVPPPRQRRR